MKALLILLSVAITSYFICTTGWFIVVLVLLVIFGLVFFVMGKAVEADEQDMDL